MSEEDLKKNQNSDKDSEPREESLNTDVTRIAREDSTLKMKVASAEASPASLRLLVGPQDLVGLSWDLVNPVLTVGRSHRLADVQINDDNLSKSHFQIMKKKNLYYVVDLKSTNGTFKNKEPLEPYVESVLSDNDHIAASHLIFKFLAEGSVERLSSQEVLSKIQTDPLTGSSSRQHLEMEGQSYFAKSSELSLIVFDVDNFKSVNDTYGHLAGDYVLKTISKLVQEVVRGGDLFFRYGGDEFCIFTMAPLYIAQNVVERILTKIQEHDFSFEGKSLKISVSIGFAEKKPIDKKWEDVYKRADEHCYKVKNSKKK